MARSATSQSLTSLNKPSRPTRNWTGLCSFDISVGSGVRRPRSHQDTKCGFIVLFVLVTRTHCSVSSSGSLCQNLGVQYRQGRWDSRVKARTDIARWRWIGGTHRGPLQSPNPWQKLIYFPPTFLNDQRWKHHASSLAVYWRNPAIDVHWCCKAAAAWSFAAPSC
jgi:hypothetical protein